MQSAENAPERFPVEWQGALDSLGNLPGGGVCTIAGSPNRNGSAFALRAAALLGGEGEKTAIVDADIANSEIGLPGTVAVAWAAPNVGRFQDSTSVAEFFVGSFSAERAGLELTSSVARAVAWAKAASATRIVVILPDLTSTAAGRRLMGALALAVTPNLLLSFRDEAELPEILDIAAALCPSATVMRIGSPPAIPPSSQARRNLVQSARLARAFGLGPELRLPLGDQGGTRVYTLNTTLGTAEALPPHLIRWISRTLHRDVVRAEITQGRQLDLYVGESDRMNRAGVDADQAIVAEHFHVRAVRQISLARLVDSYVGLIDEKGKLAGVGRFTGIDVAADEMRIASAVSVNRGVKIVQFGQARIGPTGSVLETP